MSGRIPNELIARGGSVGCREGSKRVYIITRTQAGGSPVGRIEDNKPSSQRNLLRGYILSARHRQGGHLWVASKTAIPHPRGIYSPSRTVENHERYPQHTYPPFGHTH